MIKTALIHILLAALLLMGCTTTGDSGYDSLQKRLDSFVQGKYAHIGIAVIINGKDTVAVNGSERFPMMSVYKFPIALAVAEHCRATKTGFSDSIPVSSRVLRRDTYSPMLEHYGGADSCVISIAELLAYTLQLSDNNASDILLASIGGTPTVQNYIRGLGISNMDIRRTEAEMHANKSLCWENSTTPLAAARLADLFDSLPGDTLSIYIRNLMESCSTGTGRIAAPFAGTEAVIGHKTGTGDITGYCRISAVNDVGYVHLPDGNRYSIAVFIADSHYDMPATEAIIAEISSMIAEEISAKY